MSRYVRWKFTPVPIAPPRGAVEAQLVTLRALPDTEITSLVARFEQARAERPARLAGQRAAAEEEARAQVAARSDAMRKDAEKTLSVLRKSPAGTEMFCESSTNMLLAVGEPITRANYNCDLLAQKSMGLREILSHGWSVVSERRATLPTYTGEGLVVSLQLRKIK